MIRHSIAAITLLTATSLSAQAVTQDAVDARYNRALAAGYKALFLCSAIANAERNGATRTVQSVLNWELKGIQAPFDDLMPELGYNLVREQGAPIYKVSVDWDADAQARVAAHTAEKGCSLLPIGYSKAISIVPPSEAPAAIPPAVDFKDRGLSSAADRAFEQDGPRTTAVLVMRDGKLLGERYARDFGPAVPQRTWSVAKSIAATLVGAAEYRGASWRGANGGLGENPADPRSQITIDNLLRMASGRYSDTPGNRTDPLYFGGSTVEETALHWPLVNEPGAVFRYANNDTLAAIEAIEASFVEQSPADFFARLGMTHTVAETDWQGDYILSSQVWSTARDLAKLGQLYLDGGVLPDGERVLPEDWPEYVSSPTGPQPDGPFGYGAGFWLLNASEGVPTDTYAAMGNRGQFIIIVPSLNVVMVRRGEDPVGSRFDIAAFVRDVLQNM